MKMQIPPSEAVTRPPPPGPPPALHAFLANNHESVLSLLNTLRSVSYLLPGKFAHADIAAELLFSIANLLTSLSESVLSDSKSAFNKYVASILKRKPVNGLAMLLKVVECLEVLGEMVVASFWNRQSESGTSSAKYKYIHCVELLKFVLRMMLFSMSGHRTLLQSSLPEPSHHNLLDTSDSSGLKTMHLKRSRKTLPSPLQLPSSPSTAPSSSSPISGLMAMIPGADGGDNEVTKYILAHALTSAVRDPLDLVSPLSGIQKLAEIGFLARSLIYVTLLRISKNPKKAYYTALTVEVSSLLIKYYAANYGPKVPATTLEKSEFKRRAWLLIWYLVRQPIYGGHVKTPLSNAIETAKRKPIISIFANVLGDYLPLWEKYHFYTFGN